MTLKGRSAEKKGTATQEEQDRDRTFGPGISVFPLLLLPVLLFAGCVSVILNQFNIPESRPRIVIPAFFDLPRKLAPVACPEFELMEEYKSCEFSFRSWYISDVKRNDQVTGRLYIPFYLQNKDGFIVLSGSGENISSWVFATTLAKLGFTTVRLYAGFRPLPKKITELAAQKTDVQEALNVVGSFFRQAMRQRVIDIMRIADFLETTYGISQFHVVGASLGGIVGNLFAAVDPRVQSLMMVLSSANLAGIISGWDGPLRRTFINEFGISQQDFYLMLKKELEVVEPITYREGLPKKILIVSGLFDMAGPIDAVIPFSATVETWKAFGYPQWIIIGTGHFTSILTLLPLWIEFPHFHHIFYTALQPYASHILVEHFLPLALR